MATVTRKGREAVASVRLTEFQAVEVEVGLDIDSSDKGEAGVWGDVTKTKRKGGRQWVLHIYDLGQALYRITSSRDILSDNASDAWSSTERLTYLSKARSLQQLIDAVIDAAGGPEQVPEHVKRWL